MVLLLLGTVIFTKIANFVTKNSFYHKCFVGFRLAKKTITALDPERAKNYVPAFGRSLQ